MTAPIKALGDMLTASAKRKPAVISPEEMEVLKRIWRERENERRLMPTLDINCLDPNEHRSEANDLNADVRRERQQGGDVSYYFSKD